MTTNVVETESTTAVVTENDLTSVVEVTSAGPAGPPGGALTIQDEGVDEGLLTDKINFAGSTVSVANDTEAEIATVTVNAADPGANTNITSLGGITGGISSPDYVQFDTAAAAAGAVGRLLWNDTDGTLEFQMKGGNVTLQIGQEEVIRVTNKAGVTMTDGQAVYITGSTGNHLNVTLAQANAEATSSKTLAVVTETIANNNTGFATSSGLVRGLNTSALTEGAAIWLSPTVPGGLTSTKPVAPNHAVLIGWCVRQHASVGVIYVHIANGYELEELHNVLITAAANNQVLRYDAATGLWKNATISPTLTLTGDVSGSATFTDLGNATLTATVADDSHNHIISNVDGLQDALDSKLPAASYTAADVLTKIKTVDGTGSGLDADLLDGQDGAHYLDFTNATNKPDPTITLAGDATGSVTLTDLTSGTLNVTVVDDSHNHVISNVDGLQDALDAKLPSASYTAADVLDKIKTVDGAGSGLDADLLDGQSSAYYTAINDRLGYTAENAANKGVAGGYASLDGAGLVPATQLPSYVDDVLEFANLAAFPATGESGKIYVAVDTSKTYRWSGSTYVEISASPGSTDAVPEGSTNLYFTTARARQSVSAGTGISYNNTTGVITNAAPDQTVAITGSGTTTVTGTYPNFTVSSADQYVGTVTSVSGTGTVNGLTLTGTVTSSGSLTLGGTLSVDLSTATVTGTLPVTKGGTGATSLTSGYLVKGNGTSAVSASVVYDNGTNVGIGVVPSAWNASNKAIEFTYPALGMQANGGAFFGFNAYQATGGGWVYKTSDDANRFVADTDGAFKWYTAPSGTAGNAISFTQAMTLDASGNLGVGTSSPGYKLDVSQGGSVGAVIDVARVYANVGSTATPRLLFGSAANEVSAAIGAQTTAATTGDLTFYTETAGALTEKARIDSNGNLGIGTSSPQYKLDVAGTAANTISGVRDSTGYALFRSANSGNITFFGVDSSTGAGSGTANASMVWSLSNQPMVFGTNNTERARITSAGLVGINTTSPAVRFHVNGNTLLGGSPAALWSGITLANDVGIQSAAPLLNFVNAAGSTRFGYLNHTGAGGNLYLLNQEAGALLLGTNNAESMRITSAGNVGIGTSSPGAKLRVLGTSGSPQFGAGTGGNAVFVNAFDSNPIYMTASATDSTAFGFGAASNIPLFFMTNNTERARIDSSGNLGVGTSSPERKLDVQSAVSTTVRSRSTDTTSSYVGIVAAEHGSGSSLQLRAGNAYTVLMSTGASDPLLFSTNATERARIDTSGNVSIGTSATYGGYGSGRGLTLINQSSLIFQNSSNTWNSSTAGGAITYFSDNNLYVDAKDSGSNIIFRVNGATERMRIQNTGNVGIGTSSPSALLDVNADTVRVRTAKTPASATATGNAGDICWDSNYIYVCVATNTWKRSALSTW